VGAQDAARISMGLGDLAGTYGTSGIVARIMDEILAGRSSIALGKFVGDLAASYSLITCYL